MVKNVEHINLETIYCFSIKNEVAGFVYRNSQNIDLFCDEFKDRLRQFYRKTAVANILALKETLEVLRVLHNHGIPTIPLKGALVSDLIFEDFGVYPFRDIDLLVPQTNLFKTKDVLISKCGYASLDYFSESDLLANHYHLIFKKMMTLEVHWNLVKRYFSVPETFWWKTARPIMWNGIKAMDLSVENNILYHVFRLFDHCFHPLRFFVLLGGFIEKNRDSIDWNLLLGTAQSYGMRKLLVFTLRAVQDLIKIDISDVVIGKPPLGYGLFQYLIFSGIFSGVKKKHLKMMVYTLLLIEPSLVLKLFFKRIFPSKGEIRLRYGIPTTSKKIYFYYIINPVLLFLKSQKK